MTIKDQFAAILGLVIILVVAGLIFSVKKTGQVAGVEDSFSFKQALEKIEVQSDLFSDQGQQVIDRTIGIEVKTLERLERALKK